VTLDYRYVTRCFIQLAETDLLDVRVDVVVTYI
jgi:hypothetical protein